MLLCGRESAVQEDAQENALGPVKQPGIEEASTIGTTNPSGRYSGMCHMPQPRPKISVATKGVCRCSKTGARSRANLALLSTGDHRSDQEGLHVCRNPARKQGTSGCCPSAASIAFMAVVINTGRTERTRRSERVPASERSCEATRSASRGEWRMVMAAASNGPKPPITSSTVPRLPPTRRDGSYSGQEIAYGNVK